MASYTHFSQEERCVLAAYLREGLSLQSIARKIGRSVGAVSVEVARSSPDGSRDRCDPYAAHLGSRFRKWDANRRNPMKDAALRSYVQAQLKAGWSPEVIAGRLQREHSRPIVSHETIYQWAYREELIAYLPRGKPRRHRKRWKMRKAMGTQGLGAVRSIRERPKIVSSRWRFGDWESDTIQGKQKAPTVLTVQEERRSRFVLLTKLCNKSAPQTRAAIVRRLQGVTRALRRTLTFDRGTENAEHRAIELELRLTTSFCDPYSSWQKGSVENAIGLLRRYLPKGMDFATVTSRQLNAIQNTLNHRPRKCLGFRTPHEVLSSHCQRLGVQLPG